MDTNYIIITEALLFCKGIFLGILNPAFRGKPVEDPRT